MFVLEVWEDDTYLQKGWIAIITARSKVIIHSSYLDNSMGLDLRDRVENNIWTCRVPRLQRTDKAYE